GYYQAGGKLMKKRVAAVCLLLLTAAQPARAICVLLPLEKLMALPDFVLIFSGTVVETTAVRSGQVATFDVTRLWKGQTGRRVRVFVRLDVPPGFEDQPVPFVAGREYLVSASRRSDPDVPFQTDSGNSCATRLFDTPEVRR